MQELDSRRYELPPPGEAVQVLEGEFAQDAVRKLTEWGYLASEISLEEVEPARLGERGRLWEPNPWLAECIQGVRPGSALDVGSGQGREVVWLADLGWQVIGVDNRRPMLAKAAALWKRYGDGEPPRLELLDAEKQPIPGKFELVLAAYFYRPGLLKTLAEAVGPGGRLVIEAFHPEHRLRIGKPDDPMSALDPSLARHEIEPTGLKLLRIESGESRGRWTTRLLAIRPD